LGNQVIKNTVFLSMITLAQ